MFLLLGGALSFIVGLVGVLNFFNAILTGILAPCREFAVLQSIGMTGRQLKGMLIWEGGLLCPQRGGLWRRAGAGHGPPHGVGGDVALVLHLPPHPGAGGDLGPHLPAAGLPDPLGVYRSATRASLVERLRATED